MIHRRWLLVALVSTVSLACSGGVPGAPDVSSRDVITPVDGRIDSPATEVAPTDAPATDSSPCAHPDMDGDSHCAIGCGPTCDDCDDNDANRYPGNTEVCLYDATTMMRTNPTHDEDCDPTTFANPTTHDGDRDGDGFVDRACANTDRSGMVYRGTDCADIAPVAAVPASLGTSVPPGDIHPMQVEVCNGVDDNCDGHIDEGDPGGGGSCGLAAENVCRTGVNHCVMGALTCVVDYTTPGYCCTHFADCDHSTINGCEANLEGDIHNCGACGTLCPSAGGSPSCIAGVCSYTSCSPGMNLCGGTCVNEQVDARNCNGCGHVCPSTGGTPACVAGVCQYSTCASGLTQCGAACVSVQTDVNNCGSCGVVCPVVVGGTAACVSGSCTGVCGSALSLCGAMCVDEMSDVNNCGACGHACPNIVGGTAVCTAGVCDGTCPSALSLCITTCLNLQNDTNNCGSCGNRCATGATCNFGFCQCPPMEVPCGGFGPKGAPTSRMTLRTAVIVPTCAIPASRAV
jgi:hypothetical protein